MNKEQIAKEMISGFLAVQRTRPLVHMIPNYVTAAFCADGISAMAMKSSVIVAGSAL